MSTPRRAPRDYDPPGSRYGDPADLERSGRAWREFSARIDAEDAKRREGAR